MKLIGNFFVWFFVILLSVNAVLMGITYSSDERLASLKSVTSPLPNLFNSVFPKDASASEFWQPATRSSLNNSAFELTATSAISYDISTNTLIYGKEIEKRLPMASLTKIMTAIIALERMDLNSELLVTKKAAEIGESSMGLSEGEKLPLTELMYGLILHSGNDAAETIASGSNFGTENFVHLMNKKAEDLGLSNTRFTNVSGLQGDGQQYSTAKDLLVITRYALQNKEFAKVAATYQRDIPASSQHKAFTLYNETNLLTTYPGVKGVKTGYTDEAGMCLVTYLEYNDRKIIAVLLNSQNRRQEMKELLDFSLKTLGDEPPQYN
ncbi:MAG: D-alanyl-D-alanine carboxypeptidase family protein [Candidatus Levybacteria bacterium]|nr:D-alanyl-D-alanine carboxypeptidase family protein [Candidatus Levybacteria bacterium]